MAAFITPSGPLGPMGETVFWWRMPDEPQVRAPDFDRIKADLLDDRDERWRCGSYSASLWLGHREKHGYLRLAGASIFRRGPGEYVVELQIDDESPSAYVTHGQAEDRLEVILRGEPFTVPRRFLISPDMALVAVEQFFRTRAQATLPDDYRWTDESPWLHVDEDDDDEYDDDDDE